MGIDRVLFSVDYPYVDSKAGTDWMAALQLNATDKGEISRPQRQAAAEDLGVPRRRLRRSEEIQRT